MRVKRTIRVRIFAGDQLIHETVVDSKGLRVIRDHTNPSHRIEISPAPTWEQEDRWTELKARLDDQR